MGQVPHSSRICAPHVLAQLGLGIQCSESPGEAAYSCLVKTTKAVDKKGDFFMRYLYSVIALLTLSVFNLRKHS